MKPETFKTEILRFASLWNVWSFIHYNKNDPEAIGIKATFTVSVPDAQSSKTTSKSYSDEDDDDFPSMDDVTDTSVAVCFR